MTSLHLRVLFDPMTKILGEVRILSIDIDGHECLDVMPERVFIQIDREVFNHAAVNQCFDSPLAGARREIDGFGQSGPADPAVALQSGQDTCVVVIHGYDFLREMVKIAQKTAELWEIDAEFARTLRAISSTLKTFVYKKESAGGHDVASQEN